MFGIVAALIIGIVALILLALMRSHGGGVEQGFIDLMKKLI